MHATIASSTPLPEQDGRRLSSSCVEREIGKRFDRERDSAPAKSGLTIHNGICSNEYLCRSPSLDGHEDKYEQFSPCRLMIDDDIYDEEIAVGGTPDFFFDILLQETVI